jgi:DNA repair protein RadD
MTQQSLFKLRDYQAESCTSTARALSAHRRALLVAPTASGKGVIIAELCRRIRAARKSRILVLCHQGHLLTQNEKQIKLVCGDDTDTGVYCADQGRKEHWNEIVLASRDSLGRNPEICGQFEFIICDEAHMIDPKCLEEKNETNYAKIFKAQKDFYCIGLTGTPWRLGNGHLVGKDTFFEVVSYEIKMDYLIEEGYLSPYTLPYQVETIIDTSELEVRGGGDYREADLDKVSATTKIINKCLDVWQDKAADRKCSIFFCCSKIHAGKVKDLLGRRISPSEIAYIDGDITGTVRRQLLKDIGEGKYKAIVNIGVLTTGFDAPIIDCIVYLRATASAALFVQMGGRGLRLFPGKNNCLMLDLAGNFDRFKSLSEPYVKKKGKSLEGEGGGNGPGNKTCPACGYETSSAAAQCEKCFHIFISHSDMYKSRGYELTYRVESTHFEEYVTRNDEECLKVHFRLPDNRIAVKFLLIYRKQKWADKHRAVWAQLQNIHYQPDLVKVTKRPNSKYEDVEIIKWRERKGQKCCDWVEAQYSFIDYSQTVICCNCGEPI